MTGIWNWELGLLLICMVRIFQSEIQFFLHNAGDNYHNLWRMVTVMVSVRGSETYLVITYTKLSLCLTFSLIRTRVTLLDSQLLGIDMWRNKGRIPMLSTFGKRLLHHKQRLRRWVEHKNCGLESAYTKPICLLYFFAYQLPVTGNQAMWLLSE